MAAGPVIGSNPSAAWVSRSSSSSVSSRSAAAALASSCWTLLAPGMATTLGLRISHAKATCAGVASWDWAISRSASSRARPRSRFSGRNNGLFERTPPGIVVPSQRADKNPCPSGL